MDEHRQQLVILWSPLVAATAALVWIVPDLPLLHLDDPSHLGVIGYLLVAGLLLRKALGDDLHPPRTLLACFLLGMPLVYVANWARFGGPSRWLLIELTGVMVFGAMAWLGRYREIGWLPAGIAAHAVWDAGHIGTVTFVPTWYAVGCVVIDIAVSGYLAALCRRCRSRSEAWP